MKIHSAGDFIAHIPEFLEHLAHVLPSQAPLSDFVHHNTLHGYQHLPFPDALATAAYTNGTYGYLPARQFRQYYRQGRINRYDIDCVLERDRTLRSQELLFTGQKHKVLRGDIYRLALLYPVQAISLRQLIWEIEERHALEQYQTDIPLDQQDQMHEQDRKDGYASEASAVNDLWQACLSLLGLTTELRHAESLLRLAAQSLSDPVILNAQIRQQAQTELGQFGQQLGQQYTLGGALKRLLGKDLLTDIQPALLRYLGHWLDQGMAAWQTDHPEQGFFAYWRSRASVDLTWLMLDISDWTNQLAQLPDSATDTLISELQHLGIPDAHWFDYLQCLALELPGWSGMVLWRHQNPHYQNLPNSIDMLDYLAVRLVLERLFANHACQQQWGLHANWHELQRYFSRHPFEWTLRYHCQQTELPEYLLLLSLQQLETHTHHTTDLTWLSTAQMIWLWLQQNNTTQRYQAYDHGWRLFRLSQLLGLNGVALRQLKTHYIQEIFHCLSLLDEQKSGYVWLQAYENHYRDQILQALLVNHARGAWQSRPQRPSAQLIFCMDDREEGFRRHLEEINPKLETFGAAAFFNLPMNWRGLDADKGVKLCPVPVTPVHEVREVARPNHLAAYLKHQKHRLKRLYWQDQLHQATRLQLLRGTLYSLCTAPLALGVSIAKAIAPLSYGRWVQRQQQRIDLHIPTQLQTDATHIDSERSASRNQLGFTLEEQTNLVANFLTAHGLNAGFAPIILFLGHYSTNQNNPHQAAYGCGACSGRNSGPNARTFAAMANNPTVRAALLARGIQIPDDCWFLGAEHDTCSEDIRWYDVDLCPSALQPALQNLQADLTQARQRSAHERCRKLMSAPRKPSLLQALYHVAGRAFDYSQPRPELGHVTNACAFIGRRSMSQGLFLDRRSFLISYDYRSDPSGDILERTLLSAGPVGAGISLEYYFSTVSNQYYGAGSKVMHNVTGLFAVMEGTNSDLRTGLPKQMIEIHEAMRLLIIIEAEPETVSAIYQRQPALQELIGNSWVLLAVKYPQTATVSLFYPEQGFVLGKQALTPSPPYSALATGTAGIMRP